MNHPYHFKLHKTISALGVVLVAMLLSCTSCSRKNTTSSMSNIDSVTVEATLQALAKAHPGTDLARAERSIPQLAALWTAEDGTPEQFQSFCLEHFVADTAALWRMAQTLQANLESLWGCFNKISVDLKLPLHVVGPEPTALDEMFGGFDPSAHFDDDMFQQKIAFVVVLNFPFYTLDEKNSMGDQWSRRQWAYARLGDLFTSRVPASANQQLANQLAAADNYISNYNIMMGQLLDDKGNRLFPDMALITHWGLRDELKAHYNEGDSGLVKQRMIYQVMRRIIDQSIPQCVINNAQYSWNPYSNTLVDAQGHKQDNPDREPDTRYQYFLDNFHAMQQVDRFNPRYPTAIARAFDQDMEVSYDEIEQLFTSFLSAPEVGEVAHFIEQRLGRKLEPFDIWYDGFKSRSTINEDELTAKTQRLYPDREAFATKGMPSILKQLGFTADKTQFICSHVNVDPSRGAGHAWESNMRSDNARLRTRIGQNGMDYKGYNIAVHEFGHNVEQTVTLHDVDNYIMKGVPNTAFTEALAFVFQSRDLDFLGYKNNDNAKESLETLDIFWGCYEIMGVSLVDMYSWRWLYDHPDATVQQLKEQVIAIAQQVWNKYFAPYLGEENSTILAIYSHMIDSPLYLPNYPYGHIIQFQLEQQLRGKNIADEIMRIYPAGRLTPQHWMRHAVGSEVSTKPLLTAAAQALGKVK
ncbi:MAG: hypothetical protein IKG88_04285 [Bacteroidales bacterium]|nr:hypothetical protein [Bacteroidales bacterium]